jgi:thiamine biosynthesis lipoprotein
MTVETSMEHSDTFPCFGTTCGAWVIGDGQLGDARSAVAAIRRQLLAWHGQFSRFEPDSELSRLNRDPRTTVPISATMAHFVEAAVAAASLTGGLVDPTLLTEIERAGYDSHHERSLRRELLIAGAPTRSAASPRASERWRSLEVDHMARTVTRPPGLALDSGGVAKGMFADLLGAQLRRYESYAVDCGGDLMIGGAGGLVRAVEVRSPFGDDVLHTFELVESGVATSGIAKRSWLGDDGHPAHHLLDPLTGRPAYTGVAQVTALAPSGAEAEALAKAALLAGPDAAAGWLPHGGLIVDDDGRCRVVRASVSRRWSTARSATPV